MTYDSNFDVDAVLKTLGTVSDNYPEGSERRRRFASPR